MNYYKTIEKRMGLPGLADQLADLSGSDLNTLLMEVFRLQAGKEQPAALVSQLVTNRFTMPATTDPIQLRELEIQYLDSCKNAGFSLVQFGPLAPLGTCSSMAPVSQQTILPALRNTEVVSDVTNLLALLIARDVRANPDKNRVIQYATTQRQVRVQAFDRPGFSAHFSIIGMATGGWDQGNHDFEAEAFTHHVLTHYRMLKTCFADGNFRINFYWRQANDKLRLKIMEALSALADGATLDHQHEDRDYSYYPLVQFKMLVERAGQVWELADGGLVDWTQSIIPNRKHRLMISGAGLDLILHARSTNTTNE